MTREVAAVEDVDEEDEAVLTTGEVVTMTDEVEVVEEDSRTEVRHQLIT